MKKELSEREKKWEVEQTGTTERIKRMEKELEKMKLVMGKSKGE